MGKTNFPLGSHQLPYILVPGVGPFRFPFSISMSQCCPSLGLVQVALLLHYRGSTLSVFSKRTSSQSRCPGSLVLTFFFILIFYFFAPSSVMFPKPQVQELCWKYILPVWEPHGQWFPTFSLVVVFCPGAPVLYREASLVKVKTTLIWGYKDKYLECSEESCQSREVVLAASTFNPIPHIPEIMMGTHGRN